MGETQSNNMCNTSANAQNPDQSVASESVIRINDLTFRYPNEYVAHPPVLQGVNLNLPQGTRCLLLGSNGAGKTTLLNVAGGKHMHPIQSVQVLGQPSFHNTHPGITLLTGNWSRAVSFAGTNVAYQADVTVRRMLETHGEYDKERLQKLLEVLDVNLSWRMHMVSDGQRRRVQILMALMKPFEVLLLDEVTVDLDVVTRADLLDFLKQECEERGATVLYATHIFDGLDEWATHLAYLTEGSVKRFDTLPEYEEFQSLQKAGSKAPLLEMVEQWLRLERVVLKEQRLAEEKEKADKVEKEKELKLSK